LSGTRRYNTRFDNNKERVCSIATMISDHRQNNEIKYENKNEKWK